MKRTKEEKEAMKRPTPKGCHRNGKAFPYSGKSAMQRALMEKAFIKMGSKKVADYQTQIIPR
jgi:hypothetical protein